MKAQRKRGKNLRVKEKMPTFAKNTLDMETTQQVIPNETRAPNVGQKEKRHFIRS